jgi:hypothetical protein
MSRQTEGGAAIGGDQPYDDYGLQDTIGGLGAFDSTQRFPQPQDTIGGMTQDPTAYDTSASATGVPRPMNLPPGLRPPGLPAFLPGEGWVDVPAPPSNLRPPLPPPASPAPQRPRFYEDGSMEGPFDGPPWDGRDRSPRQPSGPAQKGRAAAPKTLPPQASRQALASTGRTYRSASQPAQAVQAAQFIARLAGSNPPMQQSFPKPATQRPQSPAPKPAPATFTAPAPRNLGQPAVRYQSSGFSKPSTRR